ncbi:hypothetical protein [Priestia megaterium]|nr:hypothetical protein [Priestia megaterium]
MFSTQKTAKAMFSTQKTAKVMKEYDKNGKSNEGVRQKRQKVGLFYGKRE